MTYCEVVESNRIVLNYKFPQDPPVGKFYIEEHFLKGVYTSRVKALHSIPCAGSKIRFISFIYLLCRLYAIYLCLQMCMIWAME